MTKMLVGRPARFAGDPALRSRVRRIALITPENHEYQGCVRAGVDVGRQAGATEDLLPLTLSYPLDLASVSKAADNLLGRLRSEDVTTVACGCDPLLPRSLTEAATRAGYWPEWVIQGIALTDTDVMAQIYDQRQWAHAFGTTVTGQPTPTTDSAGYRAFKSVRPDEEPVPSVESLYEQLELLAIGLQMAGPHLTPETFEQGMFAYPEHRGPAGSWRFEPGRYTPHTTAAVVWWDADAVSPITGKRGTYRPAGEPYRIGEAAAGEPAVFAR